MPERARIYRLRQGRPSVAQSQERRPQEPLWREVLGQRLRALRLGQRETLSQTASRAGISAQYLSEIEAILAAHTGQSVQTLRADTDRDRVLTAQAAREYGIVDQVLGQRTANAGGAGSSAA